MQPNESVTPRAAEEPLHIPAKRAPIPPQVLDGKVIHREERVEYRDAAGNVLKPEQVEELKGKVKFEVFA
jgi:hypothetical protein